MNLILAAAIATIGAFHDMNYLDAKKELVEISGHPELVTDSAGDDFSDHTVPERPKAATYLNKANKRIEEALVELKQEEHRAIAVAPGQFLIAVNDLRYVSRVDMEKDGITYGGLKRKTWAWLRDYFLKPFGLIDRGTPSFWCRDQGSVELLSNPDFLTGLTGWTELAGSGNPGAAPTISWALGRLTIAAGNEAAFYYTNISDTDLSDARVSVDVFSFTPPTNPANPAFLIQIQNDGGQMNGTDAAYNGVLGVFEAGFQTLQPIYDRVYIVIPAGATVTFNSVSVKKPAASSAVSLLLLPPSDDDRVAHVYGGFYAREFSDDTDETWASVNCSGALTLMAKAYVHLLIESDYTSFKALEKQALLEAHEAWANRVHEQIEAIPLDEQRFGPISFGAPAAVEPSYQWEDT